jgi:hypothetical protein
MPLDEHQPLDCSHYEPQAGVCQHEGCGNQMCDRCIAECAKCHNTLCPVHQTRFSNGAVCCPDHALGYIGKKLVKQLLSRS